MSYGIFLNCKCCGHAVYNGSITFNLSNYFKEAFIGGKGIYYLDGKVANDTGQMLAYVIDKLKAIDEIEDITAEDAWTTCATNAIKVITELYVLAEKHGDHVWVII